MKKRRDIIEYIQREINKSYFTIGEYICKVEKMAERVLSLMEKEKCTCGMH